MPRTVNEYFQPASTGVHNNIDNLILDAELDKLAQTGSIRADTRPQYIGGVDPVVENIAMGPLLTLKSLGSVGKKILEKTGLRNPVSHFTKGESAKDILESGVIKGASGAFPGRPFKKEMGTLILDDSKGVPWSHSPKSPAVSVTRDPMFSNRPHHYVGTDIRFVMDRDDLIKKGFKIEPFTEANYGKVINDGSNIFFKGKPKSNAWWRRQKDLWGKDVIEELTPHGLEIKPTRINPRFEFEERVRGYVPTENIKLIDILQLPLGQSDVSEDMLKLLGQLSRANIPIIKSSLAKNRLKKIPIGKVGTFEDVYKLMETPTYKRNPFKVSDYYAF